MVDLTAYVRTLDHKPVAVFGLGLSGLSTVKGLCSAGVSVTAFDDKSENCDKAKELGADIQDLTDIDLSGYAHLVLSPGVPYNFNPHAVVINAQKYNLEIIGDLEILHRAEHGLKTIGITGTNGKSTTTALAHHVLNECGINIVMGGNIGTPVLDLDLESAQAIVLEISSYQMDLCPTFRPDISIILNITPDHLDRHGGMEEYVQAKARILQGHGTAVLGIDDDFTQVLFDQTFMKGERNVIPFSINSTIPEGFYVRDNRLIQNKGGEDYEIGKLDGFKTLKGHHNQQNAACVYLIAKQFGIDDGGIFKAFETYAGLPHRQYLITEKNNVSYVNDSKATNAEAAAKALSSYENIYWIIGGQPKKNGLQGLEIFKDKIIKAFVMGEASAAFGIWLQYYGIDFEICGVLDTATKSAHDAAQQGPKPATVLLSPACASWDQFKSFEDRGDQFTAQINDLLEEK